MSEEIKAPFFRYEHLCRKADEFLARHHPDGTIPVPIEEIVEFQLGMDIVPTPASRKMALNLIRTENNGWRRSNRSKVMVLSQAAF